MAYSGVDQAKSIVLIGFMGSGKSSVGRCLQRQLGLDRVDTDELVATKMGMSIPEIFPDHGEPRFRDVESEVLRELELHRAAIIVTGGGTILKTENVAILKNLGAVVWLDASEEILFKRAMRKNDRPLLQTENPRASFNALLTDRLPVYAKAADIRIDTSQLSHDEVAGEILRRLELQIK
jgi:shikimate kinase